MTHSLKKTVCGDYLIEKVSWRLRRCGCSCACAFKVGPWAFVVWCPYLSCFFKLNSTCPVNLFQSPKNLFQSLKILLSLKTWHHIPLTFKIIQLTLAIVQSSFYRGFYENRHHTPPPTNLKTEHPLVAMVFEIVFANSPHHSRDFPSN